MNSYIQELVNVYSKHTDVEYAEWSKKYLRNQFEFLGIRSPIRRTLTKQFLKEHGLPTESNRKDIILMLWDLPEREYQKAALDILEKEKKNLCPEDMPWLVNLIVSKSWWDTVDVLSPHIMGYMFSTYPKLIPQYSDLWIEDENIWLQRSAILYQLQYKGGTDEERLFRYIIRRANSDEFFVQKAIGWVLREYAKTNPESVKSFVLNHQLKPLSKREALKHLT
ncbi:DNA alkylation repair protein [Peribacillus sp. TH16]|uniref:DNA alkylation repair protein n=1 Tax=unclassified Peribacillus TaxID=2675266 RepID=UPI0019131770|nr:MULTISPECIES: DNA alkylation repair protein [unclassified Peribacillus]MBK5458625.1 DNA alkylation repair protein [Peribacillus sp. TH27]MBK5480530.1 DNA alkylation repair protein [Peribacillus sp. TH16]WMX57980.1 DNA alkylation repair protein [Peribacillus sp. R9-11]